MAKIPEFNYKTPDANQNDVLGMLTEIFTATAETFTEIPDSREKSIALTKLEESCMWAKKAVMHCEVT